MALPIQNIIENIQDDISDPRAYHRLPQHLDNLHWEAVHNLKAALESLEEFQKEWEQNEDENGEEE